MVEAQGGRVWTVGRNPDGQCGSVNKREIIPHHVRIPVGVKAISAGGSFTLCLDVSGKIWAFGKGEHGRMGVGESRTAQQVPGIQNVASLSAGYWHSAAVTIEGELFTTGYGKQGQLGVGDTTGRMGFTQAATGVSAVSCGGQYTLAVLSDGQLASCGHAKKSGHGRQVDRLTPIAALSGSRYIAAGMMHSAVVAGGQLYTWGLGSFGALGHGKLQDLKSPKVVKALTGVEIVQASVTWGEKYGHTACVDVTGQVWTWGSGYKGKLGLAASWSHADPHERLLPSRIEGFQAEAVVCGGIHMGAIGGGRVFTWGCGSDGRLGHPEVEGHRYLYKEALPRPIEGPLSGRQVSAAAMNYYHTVILTQ